MNYLLKIKPVLPGQINKNKIQYNRTSNYWFNFYLQNVQTLSSKPEDSVTSIFEPSPARNGRDQSPDTNPSPAVKKSARDSSPAVKKSHSVARGSPLSSRPTAPVRIARRQREYTRTDERTLVYSRLDGEDERMGPKGKENVGVTTSRASLPDKWVFLWEIFAHKKVLF